MLPAIHGAPELSVKGARVIGLIGFVSVRAQRGEVAGSLRVGRHGRLTRSGLGPVPEPLIRAEPEQLVLDDGAAGAGARLVLLLLRLSRPGELQEVTAGIQRRIAVKLPRRSVEGVRTGFRDDADLAAGGVSVLGREVVRLDPNLLNRVGRRRIEARRLVEMREHRPVQREQVVVRISAVHRHDRPLAAVRRILIRANGGHARVRAGQRDDVAAVHRQVLHTLVIDQIRLRRTARLHHRCLPRDDDLFSHAADGKRKIQPHVCAGRDLDIPLNLRLKAGDLDFDHIHASRKGLQVEEPGFVRLLSIEPAAVRPTRQ